MPCESPSSLASFLKAPGELVSLFASRGQKNMIDSILFSLGAGHRIPVSSRFYVF